MDTEEKVIKAREYSKTYREKNREKERERQRKAKTILRESDREAYNAYMRAWNAKHKDRLNAERREKRKNDVEYAEKIRTRDRNRPKGQRRQALLKRTYGLTQQEYDQKLESQGGGCAICGDKFADSQDRNLNVDHCHTTGKIRGLLCSRCNLTLGKVEDRVDLLLSAIEYLKRYSD